MPTTTEVITFIIIAFVFYLLYKLFKWLKEKQKRYIPEHIKKAVLKRYFNMCAVCPENNQLVMEYHHRKRFSENGDNSEQNIVPLCPYHHSLITRYPPNNKPKDLYIN